MLGKLVRKFEVLPCSCADFAWGMLILLAASSLGCSNKGRAYCYLLSCTCLGGTQVKLGPVLKSVEQAFGETAKLWLTDHRRPDGRFRRITVPSVNCHTLASCAVTRTYRHTHTHTHTRTCTHAHAHTHAYIHALRSPKALRRAGLHGRLRSLSDRRRALQRSGLSAEAVQGSRWLEIVASLAPCSKRSMNVLVQLRLLCKAHAGKTD